MDALVNQAFARLAEIEGPGPRPAHPEREHIVAHATLAAALHHWPDLRRAEWLARLEHTAWIREAEPARWLKQRRLALARLARAAWLQSERVAL